MKYLKTYNVFEKLGISNNVERATDLYFKTINDNPDKNNFSFKYKSDNGIEKEFTLRIIKTKGQEGSFIISRNKLSIHLGDRNSKSTLLHEVKHLDYFIKSENCFNNLFYKSLSRLENLKKNDPLRYVSEIFYVFDENEFQSKYHSYYIDFDKFIEDKIDKLSKDNLDALKKINIDIDVNQLREATIRVNINNSTILQYFYEFLTKSNDTSWTLYWNAKRGLTVTKGKGSVGANFKFEDFLDKDQINRLFYNYAYTKNLYPNEYNNLFTLLRDNIKRSYKTIFKKYSEKDLIEIERNKKFFENEINRKVDKYYKKMLRLVTLMCEKWVKN